MALRGIVLALAAQGLLAATLLPQPAHAEMLVPVGVVASVDFAGEPAGLVSHGNHLYLLDPLEQVVWILDPASGTVATRELPSPSASDLFFGCGGRLYVADPGERALFVSEPEPEPEPEPESGWGHQPAGWRRLALGYRVFFGAADDGGIWYNADRGCDPHLVTGITCAGDTLRLGARSIHPHPFASVTNNLNYVRLAVSPDLVVAGRIALGCLEVYGRTSGDLLAAIDLTGPEVAQIRRAYLASQGRQADEALAVCRDSLLADVLASAKPERFPIPVYVNDLAVVDGLIWVLVNNTLQIHDPGVGLRARYAIGGEHDAEPVVIHAFCITPAGRLLGLDAVHYRKIYDLGPAAPLAAGRVPVKSASRTTTGKESPQ